MAEPTPPADGLRRLIDRATPALRAVDSAISTNDQLRAARDTLVDRAADILRSRPAEDVIEGTVADTAAGPVRPRPARTPAHTPVPTASESARDDRHFTAHRMRRMATAAAREALRPAAPRSSAAPWVLGVAIPTTMLLLWAFLRRR